MTASPRLEARIAGLLWLGCVVAGIFAEFVVRGGLIVAGDAAATASRIAAAEPLWRLGLVSELLADACYLGVIFCLYELLRPVSLSLSRLTAFLGLVGSAIAAVNVANMIAPLALLGHPSYLAGLTTEQAQSLAYLFHKLHGYGFLLSMVFFSGFYLSLVGLLVFRSGFFPRILGLLLGLAGLCDLIECFSSFLSPAFSNLLAPYILLPGLVAELSMALWLAVVGLNAPRWGQAAKAARIMA